jgi:hypothetical protein
VYEVPGPVCSMAYDKDRTNNLYLVFCEVGAIFFMLPNSSLVQRSMGFSDTGYQEGMQFQAKFGKELYIALLKDAGKLLVLDSENCVLREIVFGPSGPGDFRTKSYHISGVVVNQVPQCTDLIAPKHLFPLVTIPQTTYFVFTNKVSSSSNTRYMCQYHAHRKKVLCDVKLPVFTGYSGVYVGMDMMSLTVEYASLSSLDRFSRTGDPCPNDYTSLKGSDCSLYVPWNGGVWDIGLYLVDGVAHVCEKPVCDPGFEPGLCGRSLPASCIACQVNTSVTTPFRYFESGLCTYELIPPCPVGMYADENVRGPVCKPCPVFMTTMQDNSSSINDCVCIDQQRMMRTPDMDCVLIAPLFEPYTRYNCFAYQYFDLVMKKCRGCREMPCVIPGVGQYTTECYGELKTCEIPANALPLKSDLMYINMTTNWPIMCVWTCKVGYMEKNGGCVAISV